VGDVGGAIVALVCAAVAACLGWLWWRAERAAAALRDEGEALKVQAAGVAERLKALDFLQDEVVNLRKESEALKTEAATLRAQHQADGKMVDWVNTAREELVTVFKAAASDVVKGTSGEVVNQAGQVVQPLAQRLNDLDRYVRELEASRAGAYSGLLVQVSALQEASRKLEATTADLEDTLRSPGAKGMWGELGLKGIVDMAGMTENIHYHLQQKQEDGRPDMVVHLPNGGDLPVDAKVTMKHYRAAHASSDEKERNGLLESHADALRKFVQDLARKEYWNQFERAPDFVVMFVPIEASLGPAFEKDPELLEFAMGKKVLIATPVILLALLRTVALSWREHRLTENVRLIQQECRDLYDRLLPFMRHFGEVGDKIKDALDRYNAMVGSAKEKVLPSMRRIEKLGAGTKELPEPGLLEGEVDRIEPPAGKPRES